MTMLPDFNRKIYCILGLPFDAVTMPEAVQRIRDAAARRSPCFLSTPNLNFLIGCQSDISFRNSVINSDLSVADGMPIVWLAKLLGIPIRERIAGSDLFEQLRKKASTRLSIYFFGGMEGVADIACQKLNSEPSGLMCAGNESPGFSSVQEMSSDKSIEKINASKADFLVVSLGAKKGQAWIVHNRARITVPVISHLGAVVNFVAGKLDRAPIWLQRIGLEWLWRIKEEPGLWQRYAKDGFGFIRLVATRVIPYAWLMYQHKQTNQKQNSAVFEVIDDGNEIIIRLCGTWELINLLPLRRYFASPTLTGRDVRIEFEQVDYVDSAFVGLLILLYSYQQQQGKRLSIVNLNQVVQNIFRYTCAEFLLDSR